MLKRKKRIIAKVMATTMLATTLASTFAVEANAQEPRSSVTSSKISGDDRYKTAVEISKNYSSTSKHAVVVNGQKGIVDALTATPYASLKKAPILMTQNNKLNEDTKKELTRRGIKTVDIIGGTASVSDSVKAEIEKMGITVNRIAGNSKYETSLKVAKEVDKISDISKIAVANGEVLADAVSVAAPAAQNKMPIILAHPSKGLDDATKTYIKGEGISTSYVIGGTSSVSNSTQNSLPGTKKRLEGTGRQETNAKVVKEFYTTTSHDNIYVTKSGQVNKADEIADALAVGVLAAHNQDPVLIVGKNLAGEQKTLLEGKDFDKITEVGNGIPAASIDAIKNTQSSVKNVTTVAELNSALSNAKDGDVINFKPSSSLSSAITIDTLKSVTVNIDTAHSGTVSVDMPNGVLNINKSVSNKVSVDDVKSINIASGATVKHLEIKSTAKNCTITNKGTVTTFDVLASGVTVTNSGIITTLNPYGDTTINNTGTIGNMDSSNVVGSITSPNARQVVIRFNKAIDRNSIINDNGTIGDKDDDKLLDNTVSFVHPSGAQDTNQIIAKNCSADLSENGMTLTITTPDAKFLKGNYTINIANISSNGVEQDKYTTILNVKDEKVPTVESVKYDAASNKFKVVLSEPIQTVDQSNAIVTVNSNIPSGALTWNTLGNEFEFTKPNGVLFGKDAKIFIDGIKDAAGNKMVATTETIRVNNTDLSISSVKQISNNKIEFKFSKAISNTTEVKKENIKLESQSPETNPVAIKTVNLGADNQTCTIEFDTVTYPSNNTRSLYIKIGENKLTDVTGVTNKEIKEKITLNKDVKAPELVSVKAISGNKGLEVVLSEEVSITNAGKIKLFKGEGVSVSTSDITLKDAVDGKSKTVSINTSSALEDGTYHAKFEEGAVTDINGNKNKLMTTTKVTIKNIDSAEYKVIEVGNAKDGNQTVIPNQFVVKYTGDLDTEKASYKNFKLIENQYIHESSKIEVNNVGADEDGVKVKTITVTLPSEDSIELSGKANLKVSGLTLKSGKVLGDESSIVDVENNTKPTLKSAEVGTKSHKLVLTFSKNIELKANEFTNEFTQVNLEKILGVIKITTGTNNTVYTGDSTKQGDTAKVEVINGNQLVVSVKATDVDSKWTTEVEKSNNNVKVSIIQPQDNEKAIIKDTDATNQLPARLVDDISVSRNTSL